MRQIIASGQAVTDVEASDLTRAAGAYMFSGLRLITGVCLDAFLKRFGTSVSEVYPQIADWMSEGLMERDRSHLRLTSRGILVANSIFVHFV